MMDYETVSIPKPALAGTTEEESATTVQDLVPRAGATSIYPCFCLKYPVLCGTEPLLPEQPPPEK